MLRVVKLAKDYQTETVVDDENDNILALIANKSQGLRRSKWKWLGEAYEHTPYSMWIFETTYHLMAW